MAYLISHIFVCLAFADLLGLLLGWLLWGYSARERGKEVQTLRERLADMHFLSGARMALSPEPQLAMQAAPEAVMGALPNIWQALNCRSGLLSAGHFLKKSRDRRRSLRPALCR